MTSMYVCLLALVTTLVLLLFMTFSFIYLCPLYVNLLTFYETLLYMMRAYGEQRNLKPLDNNQNALLGIYYIHDEWCSHMIQALILNVLACIRKL